MTREKGLWRRARNQEVWDLLWKIQAPLKSKHLLWRICKDCLPILLRLHSHYVSCPLECSLCLQEKEEDWPFFNVKVSKKHEHDGS
jgi:hypothetical protein